MRGKPSCAAASFTRTATNFSVHVSADVRADFGGGSIFWKARADFDFVFAQHRCVDSVHPVFERVDFRNGALKTRRLSSPISLSFHLSGRLIISASRVSFCSRSCSVRFSACATARKSWPALWLRSRSRSKRSRCSRFFILFIAVIGRPRFHWSSPSSSCFSFCQFHFAEWHQTLNDARDWQRGMLHYEQGGIAQRPERGYSWKNQSIFGLTNRLLRRVSVDEAPNPPAYANIADLDFRTVNIVIIASALLLGSSFVAAMPRHRAPARRRAGIRRTFDPDPDFYAARLRLLVRLANVAARAPDQTNRAPESNCVAHLALDRARAFNRDRNRAAFRTNLRQPVFRRPHALSRARESWHLRLE